MSPSNQNFGTILNNSDKSLNSKNFTEAINFANSALGRNHSAKKRKPLKAVKAA